MTAPTFANTETLTRVRPAAKSRVGDPSGPEADAAIPGCVVWPTGGGENTDLRDQVTTDISVLAPPGSDIQATDQIRRGNNLYDVVGTPEKYSSPFTTLDPGVLINLRQVSG